MAKETAPGTHPKLLEVKDLVAGYGPLQVLWGVALEVRQSERVALLGPNGAGKTTALRAIAGVIRPASGTVHFAGRPIAGLKTNQLTERGIVFISEASNLFLRMSVQENLLLGAYAKRERKRTTERLEFVFQLFPRMKERRRQLAGTLSGGEQKMLAVARGLMAAPLLLVVDEPSLGLAPNMAHQLLCALENLHRRGMAILLVEQNVDRTLRMTERAYVLEQGRIVLQGASSDLLKTDRLRQSYLGFG